MLNMLMSNHILPDNMITIVNVMHQRTSRELIMHIFETRQKYENVRRGTRKPNQNESTSPHSLLVVWNHRVVLCL